MLRTPLLAWLGLTVLLAAGCSTVPLFSFSKFHTADDNHPVGEILCVWEAAEGRGPDNLPCRGFGGQIMFFAKGYKEPVIATGDVRIYVFDEQGTNGDPSLPLHQFDFPAAAWRSFLAPSNLGATYQIFIPYTRKGQNSASCSLRVRITPEGGLPTYSKMATVELGGLEAEAESAAQDAKDRHVITAAGQTLGGAGQGIVTSDWSQLVSDPQAVANSVKHPTPGISMGQMQTGQNDNQSLASLRQAAALASRPEAVSPLAAPMERAASPHPLQLRPANAPAGLPIDGVEARPLNAAQSANSAEPRTRNHKHPLAD